MVISPRHHNLVLTLRVLAQLHILSDSTAGSANLLTCTHSCFPSRVTLHLASLTGSTQSIFFFFWFVFVLWEKNHTTSFTFIFRAAYCLILVSDLVYFIIYSFPQALIPGLLISLSPSYFMGKRGYFIWTSLVSIPSNQCLLVDHDSWSTSSVSLPCKNREGKPSCSFCYEYK